MKSRVLVIFSAFLLSTVGVTSLYLNAEPKSAQEKDKKSQEQKEPEKNTPESNLDGHMFDSILQRVKEDYVEEVTDDKLLSGALNGMLSSLDPHSTYLDPKTYKEVRDQTKGEFGGLGMEVSMDNGLVKVISPIDDTPAQKAGIQSGDLIVAIDKKPVMGLTLLEAVDLMRGKPGTEVKLHIKREGKDVFETKLTRAIIHVKAVKWRLEGNVGYVRIAVFDENTDELLKEAIVSIKKQLGDKLEGLILDVRNDPGGLLESVIKAADLFLPKGSEIVSTKGRTQGMDAKIYSDGKDIVEGVPIVVLINSGSASASEILAGALQDNHRALVVGTKSFGKGSVQTLFPLTNGGGVKLTTARYYTPSGRSIQAKGIEPDIVIEQAQNKLEKIDESERIREQDFIGALDTPKEKAPKTEAEKKKEEEDALDPEKVKKKKEIEDYQLMRAIDIVHALSIKQKYDAATKK
jgi:carboxyl-terminal processing protease